MNIKEQIKTLSLMKLIEFGFFILSWIRGGHLDIFIDFLYSKCCKRQESPVILLLKKYIQ